MELKMRPSEMKDVEIARLMGLLAESEIERLKLTAQLKKMQISFLQAELKMMPNLVDEQQKALDEGKKKHEKVMREVASRLEIDPSQYEVDTETGILTPIGE
jgi:hypothetical protein